jgi:hypothetical protein
VFYPMPREGHGLWTVLGAAALLAVLSLAVFLWRRSQPALAAGWLWYLAALAPMLSRKAASSVSRGPAAQAEASLPRQA